ncbi:MAG: peptide deformylase [Luteitalea sp.]|nr:peptide deformylase [Luteitalea sp.]
MKQLILRHGASVLRTQAELVTTFNGELHTLIDNMIETVHAAPGVGLAAPQIGIPLRLLVIDLSIGRNPHEILVLANPEVVVREGVQRQREGCLSLPGFDALVPRPRRIVVRGLDRQGEPCTIEGTNLLARVLEHELDHLDGTLYLDRLRPLRRWSIMWRVRRLQRKGRW